MFVSCGIVIVFLSVVVEKGKKSEVLFHFDLLYAYPLAIVESGQRFVPNYQRIWSNSLATWKTSATQSPMGATRVARGHSEACSRA